MSGEESSKRQGNQTNLVRGNQKLIWLEVEKDTNFHSGEKKCFNSELWHACAGPLVSLPIAGTRVIYFPQGHRVIVSSLLSSETEQMVGYLVWEFYG
ncbi:hypothetical protein L1987_08379 [Smallanthus sonchifolius]|uniref:Uncharacterized protein n=1 Tax=Smallanthus sonchifolius TaxID=185202 RepID=A0ACB9JKK3_9ASTR|nr:hypothetical protein L1987_08379 [Smallanthus sonchifolius]